MTPMDLTGQVFGRLTAFMEGPRNGSGKRQWLCRCACGQTTQANQCHLRGGRIKSCGCKHAEHHRTHGMERSAEYRTWDGMIQRCHNPRSKAWRWYGAKGVKVCPAWRSSFVRFFQDMGLRPGPEYSIDRIDPFGNYEPGNCRWATAKQQARNKRSTLTAQKR